MQEQYRLTPQEVAEALAQYVNRKLTAEGRPIKSNVQVFTRTDQFGQVEGTVTFER